MHKQNTYLAIASWYTYCTYTCTSYNYTFPCYMYHAHILCTYLHDTGERLCKVDEECRCLLVRVSVIESPGNVIMGCVDRSGHQKGRESRRNCVCVCVCVCVSVCVYVCMCVSVSVSVHVFDILCSSNNYSTLK